MQNGKKKVAVGLSGGGDSAVSALLLKEQGYDVTGVHMQCWDYTSETCKGNEDRSDAVAICSQLGIKFTFLNFEREYRSKVIDYFYSEYKKGNTPNPDVMCNKEIKFGIFMDWASAEGFDFVATGHYARVQKVGERYALYKGVDETKDQSYFLYRLTQEQLSRTLFPVGGMPKSQVRRIASDNKLIVADKAESMGICFVGEVNIKQFLERELKHKVGAIVLKSSGEVIGSHDGVWFYTIGQRHGFTVTKYIGVPLYVVSKDVEQNVLTVGFYKDCLADELCVNDTYFINSDAGMLTRFDCAVRIRHLGQLFLAKVTKIVDDKYKAVLDERAFGIAPGQSAVFYAGDEVLGGGILC